MEIKHSNNFRIEVCDGAFIDIEFCSYFVLALRDDVYSLLVFKNESWFTEWLKDNKGYEIIFKTGRMRWDNGIDMV